MANFYYFYFLGYNINRSMWLCDMHNKVKNTKTLITTIFVLYKKQNYYICSFQDTTNFNTYWDRYFNSNLNDLIYIEIAKEYLN